MANKDIKTLLAEVGYTQIEDTSEVSLATVAETTRSTVMGYAAPVAAFGAAQSLNWLGALNPFAKKKATPHRDPSELSNVILLGLREQEIFNTQTDEGLQINYPPNVVRLIGFNEKYVRRDDRGTVTIQPEAHQTHEKLRVIDVEGKLVAWNAETGEIFLGTALMHSPEDATQKSSPVHDSTLQDEGRADFTLSADEFVQQSEDPWLYALLSKEFNSRQRSRMRWALRAFVRYRRYVEDDTKTPEKYVKFSFHPTVKRAMELVEQLLVGDVDVAIEAARTEAENLREDIEQSYRRTLTEDEVTRIEWQNLCLRREELLVEMNTLPGNDDVNAVYDVLADLDAKADRLLLEGTSHFKLDDELLHRAVETGDATWWIRRHALM